MHNMLHHAIEFAAVAHKNQVRKGTEIPYIAHPFEVASILMRETTDENIIIAGLLHDTLEDTAVEPEDILREFGDGVLRLVQSNSENKSKIWEERKQHTIDFLMEDATYAEALLALADKLANLRSIAYDLDRFGNVVWGRFNAPSNQQKWYYQSLQEAFARHLADTEAYREFEALIKRVFG